MDKDLQRLQKALAENHKENYTGQKGKEMEDLVKNGQHPPYFFISCSDSRYAPNLLPGINRGDAFIVKNVAALVPPYDTPEAISVAAAVDYAVNVLKVRHIFVKGHTHCGGVQGLVEGNTTGPVKHWLDTAKSVVKDIPKTNDLREKCSQTEKNTIKWSLDNLRQYPSVQAALKAGTLKIHGWRYDIETGAVMSWDEDKGDFTPFFNPAPRRAPVKNKMPKPPRR